jgi:AhpD family alkylhydroperoxidase
VGGGRGDQLALLDLKARAPKGSKMADDVQVVNRRLDTSENEALIGMARMGADAFEYTADLRIDRHLAELLRLRVSQLNNCTYCLNLHYEAARQASIPRAKIDTLTAWWETELHSEAEQAALRYAEALTRAADTDRDAAFQRFHDALAENFSLEEILEIIGVVVNMNVWTRIKLAEGGDAERPATLAARAASTCAARYPPGSTTVVMPVILTPARPQHGQHTGIVGVATQICVEMNAHLARTPADAQSTLLLRRRSATRSTSPHSSSALRGNARSMFASSLPLSAATGLEHLLRRHCGCFGESGRCHSPR